MSVITDLQHTVEELKTQVANICRPATVTYVYRKSGEAGIKEDRDPGDTFIGHVDVQSGDLEVWRVPVKAEHNGADTSLWLPTEGESGYLFSPSGDLAQAFFVAGAPSQQNPLPPPEGQATHSIVRKMRGGNSEQLIVKDDNDAEVNQYTLDIQMTEESFTKLVHGESVLTLDGAQVKAEHDGAEIVLDEDNVLAQKGTSGRINIDNSEISIERSTGTIKLKVGSNMIEMNPFALNLLGALFFPTGITGLQCGVGPVIFSKAATTPGATPVADPATKPGTDGSATEIPAQRVRNVAVEVGSSLQMTLPAVPFTGVAGPTAITGTLTPGTYTAQVRGTFHIQLPAKGL